MDKEGFIPVLSFVAPYAEARQYLYSKTVVLPIYLHYKTDRLRSHYFANDFEMPNEAELILETDHLSIPACVNLILNEFHAKLQLK